MIHQTEAAFPPYTLAVRRAIRDSRDHVTVADLLFLEAWEMQRPRELGATLRAAQIRRANPALAEEISAELKARHGQHPYVS